MLWMIRERVAVAHQKELFPKLRIKTHLQARPGFTLPAIMKLGASSFPMASPSTMLANVKTPINLLSLLCDMGMDL